MDAAARILYRDLRQAWGLLPPDQNTISLFRMVQSVFDKVSNGLGQPCPVT